MSRRPANTKNSSINYWTDLWPEPRLRQFLMMSGMVLWLAGVPIVLGVVQNPWMAAIAATCWVGFGAYSTHRRWQCQRRLGQLRLFGDGSARIRLDDRDWAEAELAAGSVATRDFAWLRLRLNDGGWHYELLRGTLENADAWRRFQVIWWHFRGR